MEGSFRVAVDSIVASYVPELSSAQDHEFSVEVFNAFESPSEIVTRLQEVKPDLVVVDAEWLVVASLLDSLITRSGFPTARRVLAVRVLDDVIKVQAAHRGIFDVVDLNSTASDIGVRLGSIHKGASTLDNDDLWLRVPRPKSAVDITTVPQDYTDMAILELVCIGYRDQDIAETLHYSVQTIKNRLGHMLKRSGLTNRTQLAWQFTNQLLSARMIQNMENHELASRQSKSP